MIDLMMETIRDLARQFVLAFEAVAAFAGRSAALVDDRVQAARRAYVAQRALLIVPLSIGVVA